MKPPELVAEYIDDEILHKYVDGQTSAEKIYEIILDESINFIEGLVSGSEDEEKILISCYCAIGSNKETIIDYITDVWLWQEEEE